MMRYQWNFKYVDFSSHKTYTHEVAAIEFSLTLAADSVLFDLLLDFIQFGGV